MKKFIWPATKYLVLLCLFFTVGVLLFAQAQHGILLTWSPITGATGYNIYESATATGTFTKITTTPVTTASFLDTSAIDGTQHCYKGTTLSGTVEGSQSSTAVCATAFLVLPSPQLVATPQ